MKHHPTRRLTARLLAAVAMLSCIPAATAADLTNLRCEYRIDPLGIDVGKPRLSWLLDVSHWKKDGGKLTMEVTIPTNTSARVYVPAKDQAGVTESGKPAAQAAGVKFLRMQDSTAVYAVASGTYQFQSALP